jgi:hypothetical protein
MLLHRVTPEAELFMDLLFSSDAEMLGYPRAYRRLTLSMFIIDMLGLATWYRLRLKVKRRESKGRIHGEFRARKTIAKPNEFPRARLMQMSSRITTVIHTQNRQK